MWLGLLIGGVHWGAKARFRDALVLGLCVVSHWVLDFLVHRPDLPLTLGESYHVGLGLWNSLFGTLLVEVPLFIAGVVLYVRVTRAKNKAGKIGFWALVGFLVMIYIGNLFGPPPPNTNAIAWAGKMQWLFVVWAYWVDRNRDSTPLKTVSA